MKSSVFLFKARAGQPDFGSDANSARFRDVLKKNEGKTFRVELVENKRSLSQNALYHLYLSVIERETGNNSSDLHELFKRTLLPPRLIKVMGRELKIPATTTELSKNDFSEYITRIEAETNIPVPDPREAGYYVDKL